MTDDTQKADPYDVFFANLIAWLSANNYILRIPKKGPPQIYKKAPNDPTYRHT